MNKKASPPRHHALALAAALLLGACTSDPGEPPLKGGSIGGPFTLTSHQGQRVSDSQFQGKYRLVYFGYTYCPDICPTDLQMISGGLRQFESSAPERAAKVQPLFISTDPARDTPPVMRQYLANFHPRILGLTGTPEEIARVARAYGIYFSKTDERAGDDYLIDHSRLTILFGPGNEPITLVPQDQGPGGVAATLERWVL